MGKQRFWAIRDTDDVEKNLANQVTDYIWNIWEKDNRKEYISKYNFVDFRKKFFLSTGTKHFEDKIDSLYLVPPVTNSLTFLESDVPHFQLDLEKIMNVMESGVDALFVVSPNVDTQMDGASLFKNLKIASIDHDNGELLDYETGEKICDREYHTNIAFFSAIFKVGELPIYMMLNNTQFIENKCYDECYGDDLTIISVLKESRSVKDEIFSPAYRKGFVTQIGKHEMFVHGDEFQFEVLGEYLAEIPCISKAIYEDSMIYPYKDQLPDLSKLVKAYSNWPTQVDSKGVVSVDMTKVAEGETGYLKIEIEGGEFFKYWIYKTHRCIYEFVLHKVPAISDPNEQGSIHSPGFY